MKVYRIVEGTFSSLDKIWEAYGARRDGGRWNLPQNSAIYTSNSVEVAVKEKSYYTIIQPAQDFNKERAPIQERFERIINISLVLVEIEYDETKVKLNDIHSESGLQQVLKKNNISEPYTTQDSQKSPFASLPNRWTQNLGTLENKTKSNGFMARSARCNEGINTIFFPDNCDKKYFSIKSIKEVKLSAVDHSGNKITIKQKADTGKVLCEIDGKEMLLNILEFN